ncbi:hypothetical protein CARUB_v10019233mg [Capsella rubella]|uniref:Uncharacterized protein n=1 Tax=Capsella rubella TaxID=81985 RepID=R0HKU5_9BRAS|nr:hypothetical protein CARUB_v10019233mg [Capsella rubella]
MKTCWLMLEYWFQLSDDNERVCGFLGSKLLRLSSLDFYMSFVLVGVYRLCKIYLSPRAPKKKKADQGEENEKLKKEEVVLKEEVEHLDLYQQGQSQPHDMVYQQPQYCLLPPQHQKRSL